MPRMAFLLMLVFAASASGDALDGQLAQLADPSSANRQAAEKALQKMLRPAHLPRLVAFYKTCSMTACYSVVRLVEKTIGGDPAKAALRKMASLRTDYGAPYAAMSLMRLGDKAWVEKAAARRALDPSTPSSERQGWISYMSSFGAAGHKLLVQLAGDAAQDAALRSLALQRLCYLTRKPCEDGLEKGLTGLTGTHALSADLYRYSRGDDGVTTRLDAAVVESTNTSAAYLYVNLISRRKDAARKAVLVALGSRGRTGSLMAQAMRALDQLGHKDEAVRLARKHQDAADSYLRREARKLAAKSGGRAATEELLKRLGKGAIRERVEAAELLLGRDDYRGADVILAALAGDDLEGRRAAAQAAGALLARPALMALARALDDGDKTVRQSALVSLKQLSTRLLPYRPIDWKAIDYHVDGAAEQRKAAAERLRAWFERVLAGS